MVRTAEDDAPAFSASNDEVLLVPFQPINRDNAAFGDLHDLNEILSQLKGDRQPSQTLWCSA